MKKKLKLRESWRIQDTIPFCDIAPFLSEEEYEENRDCESVDVELYFWYSPADPSVGLTESVEFDEVHITGEYPACIAKAVGAYFDSFDPAEKYREAVIEIRNDFYNDYDN